VVSSFETENFHWRRLNNSKPGIVWIRKNPMLSEQTSLSIFGHYSHLTSDQQSCTASQSTPAILLNADFIAKLHISDSNIDEVRSENNRSQSNIA
jgi:hypothetical protein